MPKINAHGGYIVLAGAPNQRIDVGDVEYENDTIIDDVTTSGSNFVAEGLPCLVKLQSCTISAPEDSLFYLALLGLYEGNVVTLYLKRGAANQWDVISNTIVKSSRHSNPQDGKARRVVIGCEYGSLTRNVSAPAGFAA